MGISYRPMKITPTSFKLTNEIRARLNAAHSKTWISKTRIVTVSLERILDAYDDGGISAFEDVRSPELDRAKALFAQPQKKVADVAATPRQEKARIK
jgi:predicted DNA-binding protein